MPYRWLQLPITNLSSSLPLDYFLVPVFQTILELLHGCVSLNCMVYKIGLIFHPNGLLEFRGTPLYFIDSSARSSGTHIEGWRQVETEVTVSTWPFYVNQTQDPHRTHLWSGQPDLTNTPIYWMVAWVISGLDRIVRMGLTVDELK